MTNGYDLVVHVDVHVLKGIVPTILVQKIEQFFFQ